MVTSLLLTSDNRYLILNTDGFYVEAGRIVSASGEASWRESHERRCTVNATLNYPSGWAPHARKVTGDGYADIAAGGSGWHQARFLMGSHPIAPIAWATAGPFSSIYRMSASSTGDSGAPCGGSTPITLTTAINVHAGTDRLLTSYVTPDFAEMSIAITVDLDWVRCEA